MTACASGLFLFEWGDSVTFLPLAEIAERLGQALAGGA